MKWIILSNEHNAFWRPNHAGYTRRLEEAGRYSTQEAEEICRSRNCGRPDRDGVKPEVALIAPEEYPESDSRKLDHIYLFMDTYLSAGAYSFVNRILLAVYDTIKVNDDISLLQVLGYLTVTVPAKNKLSLREDLLQAAIQKWGNEDNLFSGL